MSSREIISCAKMTVLFAATELWAYKEENKLEETFRDFSFLPLKLGSLGILLIGFCEMLDQKSRLV
jgi:hypothetical protein